MNKKVFAIILVIVFFVMLFTSICISKSYDTLKATFDLYINGEIYETKNDIVVINGRTYLPLKELGEALDIQINWNEERRRVEIGEEFEEDEEDSMENVCPIGESQIYIYSDENITYELEMSVLDVVDGEEAYDIVEENKTIFKYELEEGYKYIIIKLEIKLNSIDKGKSVDIDRFDFKCFGEDNSQYVQKFIDIPNPLSSRLYEKGKITGNIAYCIKEDDTCKIEFGSNDYGIGGIWFEI